MLTLRKYGFMLLHQNLEGFDYICGFKKKKKITHFVIFKKKLQKQKMA